jgi:hypothetical protein
MQTRKAYPTDLKNEEWAKIEHLVPQPKSNGARRMEGCGGDADGWMQFVKRPAGMVGFQVLPKRWIVERTFAWLGRCRRLSKDYEYLPQSSEAFVYLASMHLMIRRPLRN